MIVTSSPRQPSQADRREKKVHGSCIFCFGIYNDGQREDRQLSDQCFNIFGSPGGARAAFSAAENDRVGVFMNADTDPVTPWVPTPLPLGPARRPTSRGTLQAVLPEVHLVEVTSPQAKGA